MPFTAASQHTRDEVTALPRDWARRNPPRRFALYRTVHDEAGYEGDVFAWGLAHDHYLVIRSLDELLHGRYVSAEGMLCHISRTTFGVAVVWVDD